MNAGELYPTPGGGVAGLVLAAGAGRRYGGPKALVAIDGLLLVERAVKTAAEGGCRPIVAVLGAGAAGVRAHADLGGATMIDNPGWASGLGSSLRAGLAALRGTDATAAVVLLVDMPGVTAEAVRRLAQFASPDALAQAGYGSRRAHPVLLGRSHWSGIADLAVGDAGARRYLTEHAATVRLVPCDDIAEDGDLDTPQDTDRYSTRMSPVWRPTQNG